MTRLVVDETLSSQLHDVTEPLELCDASGRVLGRFVPRLDPARFDLEPKISGEELARRRDAVERRFSTAEVVAYLESL